MSDTIDDETLSHFVAFTGCDDFNLARSFLRASNSNVNTAVEMYFTNPNGPPQQSSSSSLASTFSSAPAQRQTVRGAVTAPPPSEAELSHVNASASASANVGSNVSLHPNSSNQNQSSRDRERERERERARERDKSNKPKNGLFGGLFKKVRTFFGGSHHEESHGQGNNNNNNDVTTGPRPPQNSRPNNTTTTTSSTASAAPSTTSTTSIQPATLQRLSVSDGRRQALEFAKKFREKYASTTASSSSSSSTPSPPWYEDCYTNALYAAREAHRPVFIYLHSPHHADTDDFCERVLCHPGLVDYVSEHFVCWGGDISGTEGGLLASIFDVTTYPYFCIIDQEETPVTTATTTTAATSTTTTAATEKTANVLLLFSQDGNLVSETIEDLLTRIFLTIDEHRNKEAARLDLEHQRNLREHQNREYEDIIRRDAEIIAQRALEDTERERLVQEREKKVADLLQKEEKIIEELRIKVGKIEECILQRRDFIQDSIVQHDKILMEQEEAKEKYIESEEYKLLCKSKDMCDVVIRLPSGSKMQLQIPRGLELYKLHRMIEVDPSTKAELFDLDIIQRVASIFYPCIVPVGDSDVGDVDEVGNDEDLKNNKDQVIEATTIELEIIKSDILQKIAVLVNKKESSSSGSNLENGAEIDTNTNSNSPTTIQDLGLNTTVANGNGDNASNIGNNSNNNNPLNKDDDDDDDEAEEFAFLRGGKSATVNGTSSSTSVFRKQQSTLSARTNARQQNNGYNSGPNSASPSPIVKPGSTPTQPSFLRLNSTTSTTSTTSTGTSTLSSPNLSTPIQTNTSSSISLTNEQATIRYEELQSRGFIKKFQLVQPHPRTVYDDITSTFASLKIGRRAMLILEISPMTTITVTSTSTGVSKDTMDDNDNNRDEDNNESKNDKNEQSQIQYKYGHSAFETI